MIFGIGEGPRDVVCISGELAHGSRESVEVVVRMEGGPAAQAVSTRKRLVELDVHFVIAVLLT